MLTDCFHLTTEFAGASAISHEHSWPVISSFFEKEGLVSQQLSSFNYFIRNMKNIVSKSLPLEMTPNKQYNKTDVAAIVRASDGRLLLAFFVLHELPTDSTPSFLV